MPSIGGPELIFILVIVLIVFGAGKLPTVLGQLGKGVRTFREESTTDKADKTDKTDKPATSTTSTSSAERPEGS